MVGADMLYEIHKRLQQIKGVLSDVLFGNVSILAVGGLYQLPCIGQSVLFSTVRDSYAQLYRSGSSHQDEFEMLELDKIFQIQTFLSKTTSHSHSQIQDQEEP